MPPGNLFSSCTDSTIEGIRIEHQFLRFGLKSPRTPPKTRRVREFLPTDPSFSFDVPILTSWAIYVFLVQKYPSIGKEITSLHQKYVLLFARVLQPDKVRPSSQRVLKSVSRPRLLVPSFNS